MKTRHPDFQAFTARRTFKFKLLSGFKYPIYLVVLKEDLYSRSVTSGVFYTYFELREATKIGYHIKKVFRAIEFPGAFNPFEKLHLTKYTPKG